MHVLLILALLLTWAGWGCTAWGTADVFIRLARHEVIPLVPVHWWDTVGLLFWFFGIPLAATFFTIAVW